MRAWRLRNKDTPEYKESQRLRNKKFRDSLTKEERSKRSRASNLKFFYGLSLEDYDRMVEGQNGQCAICGEVTDKLHIDHDHSTNKVRGLLCVLCNTALGKFKESKEILMQAIEYVERYK